MVTIAGRTWEIFYGFNGAMNVYSFIAPSPITHFTADVKDFFTYLTEKKNYPASTQNLISELIRTFPI